MSRIIEWLGSIMFIVAVIEFVPHPKRALQSIIDTLSSNVRIEQNHLVLKRPRVATPNTDRSRD